MNAPTAASGSSAPQADRAELNAALLADEDALVAALIEAARFSREDRRRIAGIATRLVEAAREGRHSQGGIDSFLAEYGLSSEEGVLLLCLADALLRIPDDATADRLIAGGDDS
jgi:RHH-type proline utilization regulon transcriptional repressor/proline dehydrogenase/delta 1-pyrroline-5-carboxylate dehydrogenase